MTMTKTLLVLMICVSILCRWNPPIALTEETSDSTNPDVFIDPLTKTAHLVWVDNPIDGAWRLVYMNILKNGTQSELKVLDEEHRPKLLRIDGVGDGQRIFVTYDAKRTQGEQNQCANGEGSGCFEIFFTETKNNGNTWTKPMMIPHEDPKDIVDRKGPKTLWVKAYKQIVISYWRMGTMCMSMRMGDYSPFTKEVALPFGKSTSYQMMTYTIDEQANRPIYHFTYVNWTFPEENLMYTYSIDLGQTWAAPKKLGFLKHDDPSDSFLRPFTIADNNLVKNTIFIGFTLHNMIHFMWSNDNGKTWSEPLNVHPDSPQAVAPKLQICRQGRGHEPKVYMLACMKLKIRGSNYLFGSLDVKTRKWEEYEPPMEDHSFNWYFAMDCYHDEDRTYVMAVTQDNVDSTNFIYSQIFDEKEYVEVTHADS